MTTEQNILAIDTALNGLTVIGRRKDGQTAHRFIETEREQAALLIPAMQEVLQELSIDYSALECLACTAGPGSFTGLRIAISTVKALKLALPRLHVRAMDTVSLLHYHYKTPHPKLIVLETKRRDFYAGYFDKAGQSVPPLFADTALNILDKNPFPRIEIGGNAVARFQDCLGADKLENLTFLDPINRMDPHLFLACAEKACREDEEPKPLKPLYLRGADISQPKTKPRKLATT